MFAASARRLAGLMLAGGVFASLFTGRLTAAELTIPGTGDGMEVMQALARVFNAANPDLQILIPPSIGSGDGIAAVIKGKASLARAARPLSDKERAATLEALPIMRIPSAIIAHPDARITAITGEQLHRVFSGAIGNWKEIGGPDLPIKVITREAADSTIQALRATMPGWKDLKITDKAKEISTSTQDLIAVVGATPGAIGFAPFGRIHGSKLLAFAVDGRKPLDTNYPSAVVITLVGKAGQRSKEAARFLEFTRSGAAREVIAIHWALPPAP